MQSNQPILTIAIPTYNRSQYLDELLASLLDQLLSVSAIELIISDNASDDDTADIVKRYQRLGLNIWYILNSRNLGADGNILQCFNLARGIYVWIIGDDDLVEEDAIAYIVASLASAEFDIVYVSSYLFEEERRQQKRLRRRRPLVISDATYFVRLANINLTFISGIIINKNNISASFSTHGSDLVGTSLVQLSWVYLALNVYSAGLFIEDQLVGMRTNNTGGYKLFEVFGPNIKNITLSKLHNKNIQRIVINSMLLRFWPAALLKSKISKGTFIKELSPKLTLRSTFQENPRFWLFLYPIIVFPYSLASVWYVLIRVVNRLDKELGFFLIR